MKKTKPPKASVCRLGRRFRSEEVPVVFESDALVLAREQQSRHYSAQIFSDQSISPFPAIRLGWRAAMFSLVAILAAGVIGGLGFWMRGDRLKGEVLGASQDGTAALISALENVRQRNFSATNKDFERARQEFAQAEAELDSLGSLLVDISRFVPGASKLSSAKNAAEAGQHISLAGKPLGEIMATLAALREPEQAPSFSGDVSLINLFRQSAERLKTAGQELRLAQKNIERIAATDLPEEKRQEFVMLKEKLPGVLLALESVTENTDAFIDLLGGNGPRKYLFLFQNNQEMRATGGFIGSYGLLDLNDGKVRKFFIDEVYNPDWQQKFDVVPPAPLQKISAGWSLHDSNWFPHFPTSAEKAIWFYENGGGPTTDGVIAMTPTVMEKLLKITGPIELPEYDVTLDSENFIEKTQFEVELDYDKEENRPKKILGDLAPVVLERILGSNDFSTIARAANVFWEGLAERHILLYARNEAIQNLLSRRGWAGELMEASGDYLAVINTNINGFKTDGVIEEAIRHQAEIRADGTVVDTVTITRKHNGGDTAYDWWNKVNGDYMRVYVPKGAELLESSGQTRESTEPPLDYTALKFRRDEDVMAEEGNMKVDESSGTRVYEQNGKTVFANWVYVSPKESVTITYRYRLPFKVTVGGMSNPAGSYSLLAQKQSGSVGSAFNSQIVYPRDWELEWSYPSQDEVAGEILRFNDVLNVDRFFGSVFSKK